MTESWPSAFLILTGGFGSRLGGMDKAALEVGGSTLLERALAICAASPVVIVGPDPALDRPAGDGRAAPRVVREDPPHGGPAAGVAAGVAALVDELSASAPADALVGLWAVDQAGVVMDTWHRLTDAAHGGAAGPRGAVLSRDGRRQYGVGVFPLGALARACAARPSWHGASMKSLLDPLIAVEEPASSVEARDIDTLGDLEWWRRRGTRLRDAGPSPSVREGTADDDADR